MPPTHHLHFDRLDMNDTLDENMLALVMQKTGIAKHTLWEKHISCNLYIVYDTKGYLPFLYASFMCYIDSFVILPMKYICYDMPRAISIPNTILNGAYNNTKSSYSIIMGRDSNPLATG